MKDTPLVPRRSQKIGGIRQKVFPLILAWLIPILGSLLVLLVALSDHEHVRTITDNTKLPTPLFRLLTLAAFSRSVGLTGYADGLTGAGWDGYDGVVVMAVVAMVNSTPI